MRKSFLVTLAGAACIATACGGGDSELPPNPEIQGLLAGALPEGWMLVESGDGLAPPGHGPVEATGRRYVLQGPGPVSFQWKDDTETWYEEPLARESIELWVMPGSYRPSARRFLEHHRHVPPEKIYASGRIRVYARVAHRITDEARFNALVGVARSTTWSDIVEKSCTWEGWADRLSAQFRSAYG